MISKESIIVLKLVYVAIWDMQNISKVRGHILLLILCFKKSINFLVQTLIRKSDFNIATTSIIF